MLDNLPLEISQIIINYNSIKDLTNLRITNKKNKEIVKLYISNDKIHITGSLKFFKLSFPNLKNIYISNRTDLTNQDFQYLDNIEKLNIHLCDLKQLTDDSIQYLLNIKEINLPGNFEITDKSFNYFHNLEKLCIDDNHLITDNGIQKIVKIKNLSISNCSQITNTGLSELSQMTKLYIYNQIRLTDSVFINMTNLEDLYITFCNFTDQGILLLKKIKKLRFLCCRKIYAINFNILTELNFIEFSCCGPKNNHFIYLKNISSIQFYKCPIDGSGIKYLENVEILIICACPLNEEYIDDLLKLKKLKKVGIYRSLSNIKKIQLKNILGDKFDTD
jgi:hypothetical protein